MKISATELKYIETTIKAVLIRDVEVSVELSIWLGEITLVTYCGGVLYSEMIPQNTSAQSETNNFLTNYTISASKKIQGILNGRDKIIRNQRQPNPPIFNGSDAAKKFNEHLLAIQAASIEDLENHIAISNDVADEFKVTTTWLSDAGAFYLLKDGANGSKINHFYCSVQLHNADGLTGPAIAQKEVFAAEAIAKILNEHGMPF